MNDQNPMKTSPTHDPSLPFRLTADDLLGDLLWPKLFRVPRLAFRPGRIGLGIAAILVLALVDQVLAKIAGGEPIMASFAAAAGAGMAGAASALTELQAGEALVSLLEGAREGVWRVWEQAPVRTSFILPFAVLWYAFVSVAISRLSAEEFAQGRNGSWVEGLTWGVRSLTAIVLAYGLPLLIGALLVGVLAVAGWALLSVPFLNVLGAALGVLGLMLSLLCVLLLIGYVLGGAMFAPSIAVEGQDGIDAMQRVYAYVLARPAPLVVYGVLVFAQATIVLSVLGAVASLTVGLGVWAMSLLLGDDATQVAHGIASEDLGTGGQAAARTMHTVLQLPALVVGGYAVAYWSSAGTVVYLLLRRLVDGQDVVDLYTPGEIEARVDEIMDRRRETSEED